MILENWKAGAALSRALAGGEYAAGFILSG